MTFRDMIDLSLGNLLRMKLRAFLTISGVVIAIGAFVAMLSFGAGNYELVNKQYEDFGLFSTMMVFPNQDEIKTDSVKPPPLDRSSLAELARIPGVRLVYPFDAFSLEVTFRDTAFASKARSLTDEVLRTDLLSNGMTGTLFSSDSADEVILIDRLLRDLKIYDADSVIGKDLIITTTSPSLDSALINVVVQGDSTIFDRIRKIEFDSLFNADYRRNVMEREINDGIRRFINGFTNRQILNTDTLKIVGVVESYGSRWIRSAPLIIPEQKARELNRGSYGLSTDPQDLMTAMQRGNFFSFESDSDSKTYPQVTLDIDPYVNVQNIKDSVEALGYRTFSFADEFKEIQRFFLYYHLGLGVIGFIALVTASLGIVNTMVMSIIERRREIGVLKSMGADEGIIKRLFLMESAVIGAIGGTVGIILGWLVSRGISMGIKYFLERENLPPFEAFALPLWLILISFGFAVLVSLLAGAYPASRAAKVDPVEALRSE